MSAAFAWQRERAVARRHSSLCLNAALDAPSAANRVIEAASHAVPHLHERTPLGVDIVEDGHELCHSFLGRRPHREPEARDWTQRLGWGAACGLWQCAVSLGESVEDASLPLNPPRRRQPLGLDMRNMAGHAKECCSDCSFRLPGVGGNAS